MTVQRKSSVGIPNCVTDAGDGQHSAAQIDWEPRPFDKEIGCAGCGVRVVAIGEHTVGTTRRRAHFRLGPGRQHKDDCPYDYDRRKKAIADEYHAVVSTKGDMCVLRLNMDVPSGPTQTRPAPVGQKRSPLTVVSSTSYGIVHQTVQAAAAIARLLRTFEHDDDAVKLWEGSYHGQIIPWDQFHYRVDEDYQQLAGRLHTGKPIHPLAVSGRVHKVTVRDGLTGVYLVTKPGARTPDGAYFNVVLRSRIPGILTFDEDDEILAYGMWELWRPEPREENAHRIAYATAWLSNGSQVTRRKLVWPPD